MKMNKTEPVKLPSLEPHATHYRTCSIRPADAMLDVLAEDRILTTEQRLGVANAIKYLLRAGRKENAMNDVYKAYDWLHYALNGGQFHNEKEGQ